MLLKRVLSTSCLFLFVFGAFASDEAQSKEKSILVTHFSKDMALGKAVTVSAPSGVVAQDLLGFKDILFSLSRAELESLGFRCWSYAPDSDVACDTLTLLGSGSSGRSTKKIEPYTQTIFGIKLNFISVKFLATSGTINFLDQIAFALDLPVRDTSDAFSKIYGEPLVEVVQRLDGARVENYYWVFANGGILNCHRSSAANSSMIRIYSPKAAARLKSGVFERLGIQIPTDKWQIKKRLDLTDV